VRAALAAARAKRRRKEGRKFIEMRGEEGSERECETERGGIRDGKRPERGGGLRAPCFG
jgi:hypothetical protein